MAIVYAVKTGNWSDPTVWNTGSLPTSADDVRSNNFIVIVNGNYSVNSISNKSETGVAAGGYFDLTSGVTLTATNGFTGGANVSGIGAIRFNLPSSQSATLVGALNPPILSGSYTCSMHNSGTLNIVGDASAISVACFNVAASISGGIINITGSVISRGLNVLYINSATVINITGNVQALSGNPAIALATTNSTVSIAGSVQASASAAAITGTSASASVTIMGDIIDTNGYQAVAIVGRKYLNGTSISYIASSSTGTKPLYSSDQVGGNPAPSNVRNGTKYGVLEEITGTCHVPSASSVAYGVPVDATTGTAVLTADSLLLTLGMASSNLDTQLADIRSHTLNATETRAALGLASNNLDTQLFDIKNKTDTITDPLAKTYSQLQAYDSQTAAGLIYKLNVGDPTEPVIVIPAEPPIAGQCTCYLDTQTLTGEKHAGVTVRFKLSTPMAISGRLVEAKEVSGVTNDNGRLEITLLRTDEITPSGSYYIVNSPELGISNRRMTLSESVFNMNSWAVASIESEQL